MKTIVSKLRIALAGGGTGGHTYPLIAVMEALGAYEAQGYNLEFHYFGQRDPFSAEVLNHGAILHRVAVGKWRKYFSLLNLLDIPKVAWSFLEALWKLYWLMPDALFSKGGPGAFPVVVAAWLYRIPVIIHESDMAPGLTNLLSAYFSKRIGVGFSSTGSYFNPNKMILTGNPVRASLLAQRTDQSAAKERLGFDPAKPLLFVTGGSQGAQHLNEFTVVNLKQLLPLTQIYHQTGAGNFGAVEQLAKAALLDIPVEVEAQSRYKYVPYLSEAADGVDQQALALSAADLIVARAGAGSIFEFAAFGKPSILIPLDGHQRENAYSYGSTGAAKVIEEKNLNSSIFLTELKGIMGNPDVMSNMSAAAQKFYRPDAAKTLAAAIMQLAV